MVFNVGEFVEAVDECGHWATSKVVEIVNAMVLVTFVGWSSRFNRWVQHEEVRRPAADEPENSVGGKSFSLLYFLKMNVCQLQLCVKIALYIRSVHNCTACIIHNSILAPLLLMACLTYICKLVWDT